MFNNPQLLEGSGLMKFDVVVQQIADSMAETFSEELAVLKFNGNYLPT